MGLLFKKKRNDQRSLFDYNLKWEQNCKHSKPKLTGAGIVHFCGIDQGKYHPCIRDKASSRYTWKCPKGFKSIHEPDHVYLKNFPKWLTD